MKHQYITHVWMNGFLSGLSKLRIDLALLEASLPDLDVKKVKAGQRVDVPLLRQIWHKADELAQDPLLGFKIGRQLDVKGLGALAPVLMHSPTTRASIENVANYHSLINDSGHTHISTNSEGLFGFHYTPFEGAIRESPHQVLALLTSMIYMGKFMHVQEKSLVQLCLPGELELDLLSHKLQLDVVETQKTYSLWFKNDKLDRPIPGTDVHFYQLCRDYLEELLRQKLAGNHLVASIKSLVIENGYLRASVDAVTEQLGMNKRTLQRFLTEEKTSFRILKEEIIKEKSLLLIIHDQLTLEKIAHELGYSEVSAFHRAFKGWFGVTPKNYAENPALQNC